MQNLHWTWHVRAKMRQYRLSAQRVKAILHSPKRVEEGIAPKTIAAMKPVSVSLVNGHESWSQELWVMVQDKGRKRVVISAWRYPGVTKPRSKIALALFQQEYGDYLKSEKLIREKDLVQSLREQSRNKAQFTHGAGPRSVLKPKPEWRIGVPRRKLELPKKWKWPKRSLRKPTGPRTVELD